MSENEEHIDAPTPSITAQVAKMSEILLQLKDPQELQCLLVNLLSPGEIEGITLRWELLKQLREGITQRQIMSNLKICLGKISRGSRILKYGDPKFAEILDRFMDK